MYTIKNNKHYFTTKIQQAIIENYDMKNNNDLLSVEILEIEIFEKLNKKNKNQGRHQNRTSDKNERFWKQKVAHLTHQINVLKLQNSDLRKRYQNEHS